MSRFRRILASAGANMLNLIYQSLIIGLSVPILTGAWGVEAYGVWLMLSALPTYLALSDFGFSTAATNDIAMHYARGDFSSSMRVLHSVWMLNLASSAALLIITLLITVTAWIWAPPHWFLVAHAETIVLLAAYAAVCLSSRVILGVFRASGFYSRGTIIYDTLQFVEGLAILVAASLGGGFAGAAAALLAVRVCNAVILSLTLRSTVKTLSLGVKDADLQTLRRLLKPAAASMSVPVTLALSMQGVAVVVGLVIAPAATAALSAARTVSRIAVQIISAVNRALIPELSAAAAQGDIAAQVRIARANTLLLASGAGPAAILFSLFGPIAISFWTKGAIQVSVLLTSLLGTAMFFHCIWYCGTNLLSATNAHGRMAPGMLAASIGTILLAYPFSHLWGLQGAGAAVVVGEIACVVWFILTSKPEVWGQVRRKSPHSPVDRKQVE